MILNECLPFPHYMYKTILANPIMLPHPEGTCSGVFNKNPCFSKKAKTVLSLVEYLKYFLMESTVWWKHWCWDEKNKMKKNMSPLFPYFWYRVCQKRGPFGVIGSLYSTTDDKLGVFNLGLPRQLQQLIQHSWGPLFQDW